MVRFLALFLCLLLLPSSALAVEDEVSSPLEDSVVEEVDEVGVDVSPILPSEVVLVVPEDDQASDLEVSEEASNGDDLSPNTGSGVDVVVNDPIPVTVIESEQEDLGFPSLYASGYALELDITDEPPEDPPFYGAVYITGETSDGDIVTLYFPRNYKEGYFGVDSTGRLLNVTSSSISGYYGGAYNNSVSLSGFGYPRYRATSSNYDYTDLYITPQFSNAQILTEFEGRYTFSELEPYFILLMLGVIYLCCLKRS